MSDKITYYYIYVLLLQPSRETGNIGGPLFSESFSEREVPKRDVYETYITHTHIHGTHNMHINFKYRVHAHTLVLREPTRGTVDHTQSLARVTATRSANPSVKLPLPVPGRAPVPIRLLLSRVLGNPPVGRVRVVDWCL